VALVIGRQVHHDDEREPAIGGIFAKKLLSAKSPPADAPMPTTVGPLVSVGSEEGVASWFWTSKGG
jgi:hypothetical protein